MEHSKMEILSEAPFIPSFAPTPDDQQALDELRGLCQDALRDLTIRVGSFVFHRFFGGSEEEFGSHSPTKNNAFNGFAGRVNGLLDDLGLSPRTLLHYARVFVVYRQMPPAVQSALDPSHYVELHRLTAPVDRVQLALRAGEERWTVRQLREAVDEWRREKLAPAHPGGRPKLPEALKAWSAALRVVDAAPVDLTTLTQMTAMQRQAVLSQLEAVEQRLRAVREQIDAVEQQAPDVD